MSAGTPIPPLPREAVRQLRDQINNPLTAIMGEAILLRTSEEAEIFPEVAAAAARIEKSGEHIKQVMRRLRIQE